MLVDRSLAKDKDNYGCTALHFAARDGHTDIVKVLLDIDRSYHLNLAVDIDNYGYTALHFAARDGHTDIVELLLAADDSLANVRTLYDGFTALELATHFDQTASRELLIPMTEPGSSETESEAEFWGSLCLIIDS
ncbi:ankyrin repeat domain-containing protein [Endozoicomonas acroporae]|uniref:ankyrin repeat domain-containing protein n=1 Tax=Endozoicomonas acroporae TaxID=1701104 RepID=UPI000C786C99|nr:ankyrin repeat domain-containing protein [Endozoicomonas acroporae]